MVANIERQVAVVVTVALLHVIANSKFKLLVSHSGLSESKQEREKAIKNVCLCLLSRAYLRFII